MFFLLAPMNLQTKRHLQPLGICYLLLSKAGSRDQDFGTRFMVVFSNSDYGKKYEIFSSPISIPKELNSMNRCWHVIKCKLGIHTIKTITKPPGVLQMTCKMLKTETICVISARDAQF